jgi:hypothetical protein
MKASRQRAAESPQAKADVPPAAGNEAREGRICAEERHALIERAAYGLAEARGFSPGEELDDWLAAEAAIDRQLRPTDTAVK